MTSTTKRVALLLVVGVVVAVSRSAWAAGDWNDTQIKWLPYQEGLATAKKAKKPVCLIFYTEWCPHCKNYSAVFHDSKVVEESKRFVMIRLNGDQNKEISQKYAPDGQYIPRTFFLASNGTLAPEIGLPRDQFKYFYDEQSPAGILTGMDQALKQLGKK